MGFEKLIGQNKKNRIAAVHVILSEAKNLHEDTIFLRDSSLRSE
jgi:hypothetical protein